MEAMWSECERFTLVVEMVDAISVNEHAIGIILYKVSGLVKRRFDFSHSP